MKKLLLILMILTLLLNATPVALLAQDTQEPTEGNGVPKLFLPLIRQDNSSVEAAAAPPRDDTIKDGDKFFPGRTMALQRTMAYTLLS